MYPQVVSVTCRSTLVLPAVVRPAHFRCRGHPSRGGKAAAATLTAEVPAEAEAPTEAVAQAAEATEDPEAPTEPPAPS